MNYLRLDIIQTALFGSQWSDYILLDFIYTLRGTALMDLEGEEVAQGLEPVVATDGLDGVRKAE